MRKWIGVVATVPVPRDKGQEATATMAAVAAVAAEVTAGAVATAKGAAATAGWGAGQWAGSPVMVEAHCIQMRHAIHPIVSGSYTYLRLSLETVSGRLQTGI